MAHLIDRRLNGKNKSAINRERFLRRFKGQIKEAVARAVKGRSITDIDTGEKVSIPVKDVSEPVFGHARGGVWESVHPGNKEYSRGDRIDRPEEGGGGSGSGKASQDGEGEDDFVFELSREEFLNFFFDDLELPNLVKTQLTATQAFKNIRAGYSTDGTPSNIDVVRSLKGALGRRIALTAGPMARLNEAREELDVLLETREEGDPEVDALRDEIKSLKTRILGIPYIDPFDLRYSNRVKVPRPHTQAVMFCVMDVSGSMDEQKKDTAKRFFILLYLFLTRAYEKIDVVFVRHHTQAAEVNEHDFFHARDTGGTVVSSALKLVHKIIAERFPTQDWNIYVAQASDGDNWDSDSVTCKEILLGDILPLTQYYAYIEITEGEPQNLWMEYEQVKAACAHFAMRKIANPADIYPVFRDLFKKAAAHA
ncbi:YeaH/YhbH family protein [Chitinimonas koreensis]|uniref:YeaH/YhbH family protein n=1 Tax=Chitinimonas koreensis TaxID=356302 RepID=UPI000407640F|nr:YeaH/YhbH family protein [Chitinimonas koreensis]QNM95784.1 YeaH/YhbH family protein [Chitinimonas koreensis]